MKTSARSQTLEQIFKTVLTILIVEIIAILSGASTELMAAGANLATTGATFLGFGYLYLFYRSQRSEVAKEISDAIKALK